MRAKSKRLNFTLRDTGQGGGQVIREVRQSVVCFRRISLWLEGWVEWGQLEAGGPAGRLVP